MNVEVDQMFWVGVAFWYGLWVCWGLFVVWSWFRPVCIGWDQIWREAVLVVVVLCLIGAMPWGVLLLGRAFA